VRRSPPSGDAARVAEINQARHLLASFCPWGVEVFDFLRAARLAGASICASSLRIALRVAWPTPRAMSRTS